VLPQAQGMANRIGDAYTAFSGAIANQGNGQAVADPKGQGPATAANQITEGLLGLSYDVGTAPIGYHTGPQGEITLPGRNMVVPTEEA
jgi:hypothetical protein